MAHKLSFAFQVIVTWFYTIPQLKQIQTGETAGLNLGFFLLVIFYCAVSVVLSILSYRKDRDILRLYTIIVFSQWTVAMTIMFVAGLKYMTWDTGDTITTIVVVLLGIGTGIKYKTLLDPIAGGWLTAWSKGVPHLWLVITMIIDQSSTGQPSMSIWTGNFSMWPRLVQIYLTGKRKGWDDPTKGLLIGESANVITWAIVTIVWLMFR